MTCLLLLIVKLCTTLFPSDFLCLLLRGVVPGGAVDAMAFPDFGRSFNAISTIGGRFWPPFTSGTPNVYHLPASITASNVGILELKTLQQLLASGKFYCLLEIQFIRVMTHFKQ